VLFTGQSLVAYARGGVVTTITQGAAPSARYPGLGVWRHVAGHVYQSTFKEFRYNPDGTFAGKIVAVVNITHELDDTLTTRAVGRFYDAAGQVTATVCPTGVGTRFTGDNLTRWGLAVALAAVSCGRSGDGDGQHIAAQTQSPDADRDRRHPTPDATFAASDTPAGDLDADTSPSAPDSDLNSVPTAVERRPVLRKRLLPRGSGRPMDPTGSCYRSEQSLGCFDRGLSCPAALISGVDSSGTCWSFSSSCLPEGFRRAETSECPRSTEVCARQ
jgi:hypothetical protein